MNTVRALAGLALAGLLVSGSASARVYDHLFGNGFETPADAPASDAEAARFLTQATFGPTKAEIARLRALGRGEWLAEQLAFPPTLARPFVEQVIAARTTASLGVDQTQRWDRWYYTAAFGKDQLRQRMAWALSQIFVVSDQSSAISGDVIPMSEYQDVLARDSFGAYRTLLGDVTYSPTMGKYLTSFRNQKPSATTQPDENYAREVMQLFSVGLLMRNQDFSLKYPLTDSRSATYDQTVITHTAKVFTGLTYGDAPTGSGPPTYSGANFFGGALTNAGAYAPMGCWGLELFPATGTGSSNMRHDVTGDDGVANAVKTVVGGATIPANQTCHQDVDMEMNILATHANVAPFISRQLIQRFVTSNPSPGYIGRVAAVFSDNGAPEHDYGDLGAVLKAILTDPEAITSPAGDSGKLREPLIRLIAMWRAWDAQPPAVNATTGEYSMGLGSSAFNNFGQRPLGSATVFNFYEPDYQQPGPIATANLYSPEFEIINEGTAYTISNNLYAFSAQAYVGGPPPSSPRPLLDLSALAANASNPTAMVDEANLRMMYGSMSTNMRSTLINTLTFMGGATANELSWSLVYLISMSPEYATQR